MGSRCLRPSTTTSVSDFPGWRRTSPSLRASTRRTRAGSERSSRCSRVASSRSSSSTASSGLSVSVARGTSSARCPSCWGRCSLSASVPRSRRASCESRRTTTTLSRPSCQTSGRRSAGWRPTGWAGRAGCKDSRRSRRRRARSWSGIAGMRPAPSCAASWTATRSRSSGSRLARRMPGTVGEAPCRPTETCPPSRSSAARPWYDRSFEGWPSYSALAPRPSRRSTTR